MKKLKLKLLTLIPAIFIVNLSANEPDRSNNKTFSASKKIITKEQVYSSLCEPHPECAVANHTYLLDFLKQSFPSESKENNKNKDNPSQ